LVVQGLQCSSLSSRQASSSSNRTQHQKQQEERPTAVWSNTSLSRGWQQRAAKCKVCGKCKQRIGGPDACTCRHPTAVANESDRQTLGCCLKLGGSLEIRCLLCVYVDWHVRCCLPAAYRKACLEHHPDKKLVGVDCEDAKVRSTCCIYTWLCAQLDPKGHDVSDEVADALSTDAQRIALSFASPKS
jgi:hypothetical protein